MCSLLKLPRELLLASHTRSYHRVGNCSISARARTGLHGYEHHSVGKMDTFGFIFLPHRLVASQNCSSGVNLNHYSYHTHQAAVTAQNSCCHFRYMRFKASIVLLSYSSATVNQVPPSQVIRALLRLQSARVNLVSRKLSLLGHAPTIKCSSSSGCHRPRYKERNCKKVAVALSRRGYPSPPRELSRPARSARIISFIPRPS